MMAHTDLIRLCQGWVLNNDTAHDATRREQQAIKDHEAATQECRQAEKEMVWWLPDGAKEVVIILSSLTALRLIRNGDRDVLVYKVPVVIWERPDAR